MGLLFELRAYCSLPTHSAALGGKCQHPMQKYPIRLPFLPWREPIGRLREDPKRQEGTCPVFLCESLLANGRMWDYKPFSSNTKNTKAQRESNTLK